MSCLVACPSPSREGRKGKRQRKFSFTEGLAQKSEKIGLAQISLQRLSLVSQKASSYRRIRSRHSLWWECRQYAFQHFYCAWAKLGASLDLRSTCPRGHWPCCPGQCVDCSRARNTFSFATEARRWVSLATGLLCPLSLIGQLSIPLYVVQKMGKVWFNDAPNTFRWEHCPGAVWF